MYQRYQEYNERLGEFYLGVDANNAAVDVYNAENRLHEQEYKVKEFPSVIVHTTEQAKELVRVKQSVGFEGTMVPVATEYVEQEILAIAADENIAIGD
ncbi:hypothetical protein O6P43_033105 [Quillaja saponaria]|uniref:Uncharacterized protein n=1 Tax=Quillaja saponaria TaxID=32244 RepID=A0AAD7KQ17_QUISA|nr:hypothetical protein O6P43_033105 [Quillaja saponaria]